jgi:hypothetical protein
MVAAVGEDTLAIDEDFKLSVGKVDLRTDPIFRIEFALKAPGQASLVSSNQAPTNLDLCILVH